MKGIVGTIVSGLVILIVTHFIADKPELKYSLTAPIVTTMLEGAENAYLQQLSIRNVGKDEAKKISINIVAGKVDYELKKNSNLDSVKEFRKGSSLELLYDSLPPSGEIKVILKSLSPIGAPALTISHSKGLASDVFSDSAYLGWLWPLVGVLVYGALIFVFMYQIYLITKESNSKHHGELMLIKGKPFLISDKKWIELADVALESTDKPYNIDSVEEIRATLVYRFLNKAIELKIDKSQIEAFRLKAEKVLLKLISHAGGRMYDLVKLNNFICLERPALVGEAAWKQTIEELEARYIDMFLGNLRLDYKSDLPEGLLQKPDFISEKLWGSTKDKIEKIVVANALQKISNNPKLDLSYFDVSGISGDNLKKLSEFVYAHKLKLLPVLSSIHVAKDVLSDLESGDLDWLKEMDLVKIGACAKAIFEILSREKELSESLAQLSIDKLEINASRDKVSKQLEIIDQLLKNDHCILDRLEDYEIPFSEGNLKNLHKVGVLWSEGYGDRH